MELEGDRHEARRITIGVKSRGQLLPTACPWSTPDGYAEGAPYDLTPIRFETTTEISFS